MDCLRYVLRSQVGHQNVTEYVLPLILYRVPDTTSILPVQLATILL